MGPGATFVVVVRRRRRPSVVVVVVRPSVVVVRPSSSSVVVRASSSSSSDSSTAGPWDCLGAEACARVLDRCEWTPQGKWATPTGAGVAVSPSSHDAGITIPAIAGPRRQRQRGPHSKKAGTRREVTD